MAWEERDNCETEPFPAVRVVHEIDMRAQETDESSNPRNVDYF